MIQPSPLGFIGLGTMGEPMALNLVRSGGPLVVWNRSPSKSRILTDAGATLAADPEEVFASCEFVFLMLRDDAATDAVLARSEGTIRSVAGRTLINMATLAPGYSVALEADIRAAGGRYVEAPVSGSRKPAEAGQLVAMLAGRPDDVSAVRPLLRPMCRDAIACGVVPNALYMKLAVNLFMIPMVTALAEATHFATRHGLDLAKLVTILDAGPMASDVSRVKAAKLLAQDFAAQASIANVLENVELIATAARKAAIASPLLDVCHALYVETQALGHHEEDMVAVIRAVEQRTAAR
jgi:3-hydroxyisobutyrate dehydrogenase